MLDAYVLDVAAGCLCVGCCSWMLMCWMFLSGCLCVGRCYWMLMCWVLLLDAYVLDVAAGCLSDWIWAQGHC